MNARDLIKILERGNLNAKVILARDEEGNSYGTVEAGSIFYREKSIVLYPYKEGLELEEIEEGK